MALPAPRLSKKTLQELSEIALLEQTTPEKALGAAISEHLKVAQARQTVFAELPEGKEGLSAEEIDHLVHEVRRRIARSR